MSRLSTTFVLGYHGCDADTADHAIAGAIDLVESDQSYDWLGPGIYFWESDPQRAFEWAAWKVRSGKYKRPAVVGAAIDLGNCLDLTQRENLDLLRDAYASFEQHQIAAALPMPENRKAPNSTDEDRLLRYLDCAVIRHLHRIVADEKSIEPFDTVRGMFTEGEHVYPGSAIFEKTHTQIAVRNPACILGVFRPRPYPHSAGT
ncbi:MAG TPA: hypothetical protein PKA55_14975 [Rhodoblastus sp.]|nr:hypothetical protein [Rhodoblastus sp.]